MDMENVIRFKEAYFDRTSHVFTYPSLYSLPTYIRLDEIVILGPLETTVTSWVASPKYPMEEMLYITMFMTSGGLYRHVIKKQRDVTVSEFDRELYEAFKQCWLECIPAKKT